MSRKKKPVTDEDGGLLPKKFLGGYLPYPLVGHLALFTIYNGTSRAKLIEESLVKALSEAPSVPELVAHLAHRSYAQWQSMPGRMTWARFIELRRRAFARRKVPSAHIDQIINQMGALHVAAAATPPQAATS
jgi:hypothetical protein